jgi:CheY-like chemotaxis protein
MYEKYQVLFVDDEEDILRSLRRGLIDEEYSCHFVTDGFQALEIMEKHSIAVIVSDMKMPGMDGLRLLNEVRERWPKTVRIVLSGYMKLPQIVLSVNQAGVFRFITKPWRLEEEFIGTIKDALDFYIKKEEEENHVKKLESQKEVYLTILRKYAKQTRQYKKNVEFFAEMSKAIVSFHDHDDEESRNHIRDAGRKMLSLFSDAIISKREEYKSSLLTERLSQFLESRLQQATVTKLTERSLIVTTVYKVIEAIIDASTMIFHDEFSTYGVASRIGVQENDYYGIYLVTSFHDEAPEAQSQIDRKLAFFSKVLGDFSVFHLSCFAEKYSSRIVIAIILDKNPE